MENFKMKQLPELLEDYLKEHEGQSQEHAFSASYQKVLEEAIILAKQYGTTDEIINDLNEALAKFMQSK